MAEKRLAIFTSGQGSTVENGPLHAVESGRLQMDIALIISSIKNSRIVQLASSRDIKTVEVLPKELSERFDDVVDLLVRESGANVGVLMGWKEKMSDKTIERLDLVAGTHPSRLPEFARGYGLTPYAAAWKLSQLDPSINDTEVVVQRLYPGRDWDEGPILGRRLVPIFKTDTPETLQARGKLSEGPLMVEVLQDFQENRLREEEQTMHPLSLGKEALITQANQWAKNYVKTSSNR